jgi:hypothetical protein
MPWSKREQQHAAIPFPFIAIKSENAPVGKINSGSESRSSVWITRSKHTQKIEKILFFLLAISNAEPAIVKLDHVPKSFCRASRKIRSAGGQTSELLHDNRADIRTLSADECPAWVVCINGPTQNWVRGSGVITSDPKQGELRGIIRWKNIRCSDIHRQGWATIVTGSARH